MLTIKVLGTGCASCKTTFKLIEEAAQAQGVNITLEKVEDLPSIMSYGVMSTPAVVVNDVVVHAGGIPAASAVNQWLANAPTTAATGSCCSGGKCC